MAPQTEVASELEFHPATAERWPDLEALFGPRGACAGCWCMYWRLSASAFRERKGEPNRQALRELVASAEPPGILAYADGKAVGWCAIAPREAYPRLESSRNLKRVDEQSVWSISCLFITRPYRRRGVSTALVRAATAFAASRGARIVEAYPVEPRQDAMPDVFAWTGIAATFRRAGFVEVARRAETRPVMRWYAGSG